MSELYYTQEGMANKKLSDLKDNDAFLNDAVTFLKSRRKGYSEEELSNFTADDVVYDVLEHFRVMNTNEVTMGKDFYYMNDDNTSEQERQAYARLMYAFDNAKGEDLLDGGGAAILDYAEGVLTAPSTVASVAAGALTAGTGAAAVQVAKTGTQQALKEFAKSQLKRGLLTSALEGSLSAGSQLGVEINKKEAGEAIGEDYEISGKNIAISGAIGGTIGAAAFGLPARQQYKAAERLVDTLEVGTEASAKRKAEAVSRAVDDLKATASTPEGKKIIKWTQDKLLASIDPKLVEEGRKVRIDILSEDLPDGIIGGFDAGTMKRLTAAAVELAKRLKVKPEKGQRITEFLALKMDEGDAMLIFEQVRNQYGLTRRQLSAVYASEVSDAARLLNQQKQWMTNSGNTISGEEAIAASKDFSDKLTKLYDEGMSTISGEEAATLKQAQLEMTTGRKALRFLKGIEDTRRAFMTSQPATTMRNNIFGVAMGGIDMLDQINLGILRAAGFGGGREIAGATFKGATDTFAYLSKDAYVADALVTMLKQDSPELMSRVFMDAAQAEASLVGNSGFAKVGTAVNALNTMSDHVFKKAVIASYIDRELRKSGSDLLKYMEEGRIADLPDDMVKKAIDSAQAFTFQRRFGGKGASDTSKFVNKAISFTHNSGLTTVIPFPRYIASQAKFLNDYTVLNLLRKNKNMTAEDFAKQITGFGMLSGAMFMQRDNIEKGLEWFEEEITTGETTNAQAAMGPTAFIHYVANVYQRWMMGYPNKDWNDIRRDAQSILIGTEFKPGGNALLDIEKAFVDGSPERALKVFGDYLSSITYPASVLKDFYGQFDPRSSYLPETRDAMVTLLDMGGMDFKGQYLFNRFTKTLPDFDLQSMVKELREETGINLGGEALDSFLKFSAGGARTQFQLEDERNRQEGYDAVRYDVFGDGPLRMLDPFMKQITGFTKNPPKNELQMEMAKLQLDPYEVYPEYQQKNTALELFTKQMLQGALADDAIAFIKGDDIYANSSMEDKKIMLRKRLKAGISDARDKARIVLGDYAKKGEKYQESWGAYVRGEYAALSGKEKEMGNQAWASVAERYGIPSDTFEGAIEAIDAEEGYDDSEKDVRKTILTMWFLTGQKDWKKTIDKVATRKVPQ